MALSMLSLFCAAAVLLSTVPQTVVSAATLSAVTTDYLNVRSGAGLNQKVLFTLAKGASVNILDNSNASWAKIQTSSGKTGYCSKQYLKISGQPSPSGASPAVGTAVATDNLNLRNGAGMSYSIILTIKKGTAVTVLGSSNSAWVQVRTSSGETGYCSEQYLKIASSGSGSSSGGTVAYGTGVTMDYLNLRQSAGTNGKVILILGKGVAVTVLDSSNPGWAKVRTASGKEGYVSKDYLKITSTGSSSGSSSSSKPASSSPPSGASSEKPASSSSSNSSSSSSSGSSGTPSGQNPTDPTPVTVTGKTTDALNLRTGPGANYSIILTMAKGTTVTVTDQSNDTWVKVKTSSGKEGYCSKQYLTISQSGGTDLDPMPHTVVGATVTADVLRLRQSASAGSNILANLPNGTVLMVLDISDPAWYKVSTSGGLTGYVSAEFIKLRYSDDDADTTALSLSTSSGSIPLDKTLYIKGSVTPNDNFISWSSSNSKVATVVNGYVLAVGKGSAVITASSGNRKATCSITVTDAEPVRTAFAGPNIAGTGETVTLTAVTDTTRDGVSFVVNLQDGSTKTVKATSCVLEQSDTGKKVKKWTGTTTFDKAGRYTFTAYSSLDGKMSTAGYTTDCFVSGQKNFSETTSEQRRISDQMLSLVAKWEGCSSTVYADRLTANQVPTLGYGYTFGANTVFYNNITQTEAWSLLVNKINNSSYTTELNKMIQNNQFLMSQNQADCLISFAYNVGAGYFNSSNVSDFIVIMKNAVVPPALADGQTLAAKTTRDTYLRSDPDINSAQVGVVSGGTSVSVIGMDFSETRNGWYRVNCNGKTGWLNSGYVSLSNASSLKHDLNYTNAYAFGTDFIRWCLANNTFLTGLFYRRMGEVNVYNYGDYSAVRSNKYGYTYPNAAAGMP